MKMFKELYYASDIVMQILPFLRKEMWRKNLCLQRWQYPHPTTSMTSVHLLHIKLAKKPFLFSLVHFWMPVLRTDVGDTCLAVVTTAPPGDPKPALATVASPARLASSAQWLFQQTHVPKQTLARRKPSKLSLTISKRGDVSQVLSADLCNILHHEDLPGQLIQEVSCHKWCFTGEHNLLVKTNGKRQKGVIKQKKAPSLR